MKKLREELRAIHHFLQHSAHVGERPMHFIYFVLVCWSAKGAYGLAAGACALIVVLADHHNNDTD